MKMEENEEFNSDFNPEDIPISEEFWNYMEHYWHNNREFPESTEASLNKKADLVDGKVPSSQLPSYVDDVLEYDTFESLPNSGEKGKIYVITNNNTQFRWSGSEYIQLNSDENIVTTDTNQDIIGRKSFITAGGNGYNNNSLRLLSNDGSNPGLTFYKGGVDIANMYFDGKGNFKFRNADDTVSRYVFAQGFKKDGSDDNSFLTAGGSTVLRSTYPTTNQADAKYIPYFGATANINLNAKPIANAGSIDATNYRNVNSSVLVKSFSLHNSTSVTSLGIKLTNPGTSIMMGSFTVTVFGYIAQTLSFRVSMYKYLNSWHTTTITWLYGDSSKISNIEFYKEDDSNLHLKVNFTTNFGAYNKTVITDVLANGQSEALHNPDTYTISVNPDNSTHTLQQATTNISFVRDHITANTNQTGLKGNKTISGVWVFNGTNANSIGILRPGNTVNASIAMGFDAYSQFIGLADANTFAIGTNANLSSTANRTFWVDNLGNASLKSLIGTDNRMVIADPNGKLITQAIPNLSAYLPLTGGTMSSTLTFNGFSAARVVKDLSTLTGGFTRNIFELTATNGLQDSLGYFGSNDTSGNTTLAYGYLGATAYNTKSAIRWTPDGRVGIGLTSSNVPQTGYALHISGNAYTFGNSDVSGNINSNSGELVVQRLGVNRIRTGSAGSALILSGENSDGSIIFRPLGDNIFTGQVSINSSGTIVTANEGNSTQWNSAVTTLNSVPRQGLTGGTVGSVRVSDTRNVNSLPSTDLATGIWFDFKLSSTIGLTGTGLYSSAITMVPYSDNSGNINTAFRLAQSADEMYFQNYASAGTWGAFRKMWTDKHFSQTNINNWNNAFNFTSNFTTNYNDLVAIEALSGTNGYLRKDGNGQWSLVSSPVVDATATIAGKVKLGSDTIQTVASNFVTATIGKTYSVQVNSSGQLVVNVGWSDTNTTYTGNNGITLTGTNFTPTYGTSANTVAQGNDSRINNGQTAFGWGNHATAGYTSQSWVQSQNYATSNFVEERIDKLTGEIIDPTPSFSIKNEFTTVILTENFSKEPLELEGELIPERYISIINLTGSKVELTRDHNPIDIIYENETSEYYITKERRLVKKGTYKSAKTLI